VAARGAQVSDPDRKPGEMEVPVAEEGMNQMQKLLFHSESTALAEYNHSGLAAFMQPTAAPAQAMRFTPQPVVNWLYQALAYGIMTLQSQLGTHGRFNCEGHFLDETTGLPASGGQLCVVWGTEIGARRDQAVIAWDYDTDLAVFKTPDCDFSKVWLAVKQLLEPLGLQLLEHDPGYKFRIAPLQPVAFSYSQQRRHDARLQNPRASRPELMRKAAEARLCHEPMINPTGINCVDIEVHTVKAAGGATRKKVVMQGAQKKIALGPSSIFPIVEGILGPLRVPVPSTTDMLDAEYGKDWRTQRSMKVIASNCSSTMRRVSNSARSSAWPSVGLRDCQPLLGGFWGAGLEHSKDDVPWRFL